MAQPLVKPSFRVAVEVHVATAVVRAIGTLDAAAAAELDGVLRVLAASPWFSLCLDLGGASAPRGAEAEAVVARWADVVLDVPPPDVEIAIRRHGGCLVVAAAGELDLASAPALERASHRAVEEVRGGLVVIDLAAVRLLDATALHALATAAAHAEARGADLRILPAPAPAHSVVRALGLEDVLPFVGARAERPAP